MEKILFLLSVAPIVIGLYMLIFSLLYMLLKDLGILDDIESLINKIKGKK